MRVPRRAACCAVVGRAGSKQAGLRGREVLRRLEAWIMGARRRQTSSASSVPTAILTAAPAEVAAECAKEKQRGMLRGKMSALRNQFGKLDRETGLKRRRGVVAACDKPRPRGKPTPGGAGPTGTRGEAARRIEGARPGGGGPGGGGGGLRHLSAPGDMAATTGEMKRGAGRRWNRLRRRVSASFRRAQGKPGSKIQAPRAITS